MRQRSATSETQVENIYPRIDSDTYPVLSVLAAVEVDVAEGGVVVPLVLGRAIGAMGRPMRPTSGAGVALILFELPRRPAPGARPELSGAMGACGRGGKDMLNGPRVGPGPGEAGKPGGSEEGASAGDGGRTHGRRGEDG